MTYLVNTPSKWGLTPIGRLFRRRESRGRSDLPLLSVYRDWGVVERSGREDNYNKPGNDLEIYKHVRCGDLVLNKMKTWQGSLGVSSYEGIVSPAYFVAEPTAQVEPRYIHHLLRSQPLIAEYAARSKGIRPSQWDLPWEEFARIVIAVPPDRDQRAIADFLDAETARIDALIAKKRRLDELLRTRLSALIGVKTTEGKGTQVRRVISLRTSGPRGWAERISPSGVPFVRSANLEMDSIKIKWAGMGFVQDIEPDEAERSRARVGDVLVGITGANTGWVGFVERPHEEGYVSQHVGLLRPRALCPKWLAYSIFSPAAREQLLGGQYGGTKQQLSLDELAELTIHVPSPKRQKELLVYIDQQVTLTEQTRGKLRHQINLLAEHRQALITAAVTGEIEVPGATAT